MEEVVFVVFFFLGFQMLLGLPLYISGDAQAVRWLVGLTVLAIMAATLVEIGERKK
jgi:hypothetical protein